MECPVCGYHNGEWARCPRCGTNLEALLSDGTPALDVQPPAK
jgi:primosomal protein N'